MKVILSFFALAIGAVAAGFRFLVPTARSAVPAARLAPPVVSTPPVPLPVLSYLDNRPVVLPLGWRPEDGRKPFSLSEVHLAAHQLVIGATRTGKSRYCELQGRRLIDALRGFMYIDPEGDTAENLAAYAHKKMEEEGEAIKKQVVFIELNFATIFGCDPFVPPDFSHIAPELQENAYRQWLSVKVDQFIRLVQAKQGDNSTVGMPRFQRTLTTVLKAIGTVSTIQDDMFHSRKSSRFWIVTTLAITTYIVSYAMSWMMTSARSLSAGRARLASSVSWRPNRRSTAYAASSRRSSWRSSPSPRDGSISAI